MGRSARIVVILLLLFGFAVIVCTGTIFIISGGNPVDFAQKTLICIELAGRENDLNRSISDDATPIRFTVEPGDTPRLIAQNLGNVQSHW